MKNRPGVCNRLPVLRPDLRYFCAAKVPKTTGRERPRKCDRPSRTLPVAPVIFFAVTPQAACRCGSAALRRCQCAFDKAGRSRGWLHQSSVSGTPKNVRGQGSGDFPPLRSRVPGRFWCLLRGQKARVGAGRAQALPYFSCRRHTILQSLSHGKP